MEQKQAEIWVTIAADGCVEDRVGPYAERKNAEDFAAALNLEYGDGGSDREAYVEEIAKAAS